MAIEGCVKMLDVVDSPTARCVQEAERRRLARELHDSVVQSLTALVADLEYVHTRHLSPEEAGREMATRLEMWQGLARESLNSMRQVLASLRGRSAAEFDLAGSIQELLSEMRNAGYTITYECDDWPISLPLEYAANLYYIIRESLANIHKHASASLINIFVFCYEGRLHLSIGDNGVGMQVLQPSALCVPTQPQDGYHVGLVGLRERVAVLSGRLSIESVPDEGTRIDVEIPLP